MSQVCSSGCADQPVSLQALATTSLHRTIGLRTVLPLLDWCKARPALLADTHQACTRFVVQTFDALVDVEGAAAVSAALDNPELFGILQRESEEQRRTICALRTPGRILVRGSPSSLQSAGLAPNGVTAMPLTDSSWTGVGAAVHVGAPAAATPAAQRQLEFPQPSSATAQMPEAGGGNGSSRPEAPAASSVHRVSDDGACVPCYPYSRLTLDALWPPDIDPAQRERHLTDDDFELVFGMQRFAYQKLAVWKQLRLRKEKGLF